MKRSRAIALFLVICTLLSISSYAFAAGKSGPPSDVTVQAVPTNVDGMVTPMINDTEKWWANAHTGIFNDGYPSYGYYYYSTSSSRTETNAIRDIDYIYARSRLYKGTSYLGQVEDTNYDAADADATKSFTYSSGTYTAYGTHKFKESGYVDTTLETSKTY